MKKNSLFLKDLSKALTEKLHAPKNIYYE